MGLNKLKTCPRVTPLTERQGHDKDEENDRDGDHDDDYAGPYGQRHGHGPKDTPPTFIAESLRFCRKAR